MKLRRFSRDFNQLSLFPSIRKVDGNKLPANIIKSPSPENNPAVLHSSGEGVFQNQ
jgi:hypothetical protein